jgi:hypothetical protein
VSECALRCVGCSSQEGRKGETPESLTNKGF